MTHGRFLVLLKSKAEADSFFRPTTTPPGQPGIKDPQALQSSQATTGNRGYPDAA